MKYRTLGRTGLRCSEIGLGTWAFASRAYGDVEEKDAVKTIRVALDAGINFFDTAPLYGTSERDGVSEEILGRGLG
ncbi:MAG: aldo/keto reductase, partial [Bacteroidota bacterium]